MLGYAILKNREDVVKELVKESSIDINKVSGNTNVGSLQLALALTKNIHGSSIAMALLESKKSSELNFTLMVPTIPKENSTTKQETNEKPEGNNVLHQGIINGYFNVVQQLVSKTHKAKVKSILNKPNHNKHTPLQLAIDKYLHFVREQTDNSNKDKNDNSKKISSTHTVYDQWYAEVIEYLLELEQIDLIDIRSNTWSDFIKTAYQNQDKKLIGLLVKHKNAPIKEIANQAIKHKDEALLESLKNNDNINIFSISYPLSNQTNDTGTLLCDLIDENQPDQVQLLIKYFGIGHRLFKNRDIAPETILERAIDFYIRRINRHSSYYQKTQEIKKILTLLLDDLYGSKPSSASFNFNNTDAWRTVTNSCILVIKHEAKNRKEDLVELLVNYTKFISLLLKNQDPPVREIAEQAININNEELLQLLANNDTINFFSISYPLSNQTSVGTLLYELIGENNFDKVELLIKHFGAGHQLLQNRDLRPEPILNRLVERYIDYPTNKSPEYLEIRRILILLLKDLNKSNQSSGSFNSKNTDTWIKVIEKEVEGLRDDLIQLLANHKRFKGSSIDKALQKYKHPKNNESGDGLLHRALRDKEDKNFTKARILTHFTSLINVQNGIEEDDKNDTPLHIAVYNYQKTDEDKNMIKHLLTVKGINLNIQNRDNNTPLHFAAQKGFYDIAEILVKNGADKAVEGETHRTPYNMAQSQWPSNKQ